MQRIGISLLSALQPTVALVRYERQSAGNLLYIDIKKLGRIRGIDHRSTGGHSFNRNKGSDWDAVHLVIDDHSRVSFAQVLLDETAVSCVSFPRQAVAHCACLGVRVEQAMTDNDAG